MTLYHLTDKTIIIQDTFKALHLSVPYVQPLDSKVMFMHSKQSKINCCHVIAAHLFVQMTEWLMFC